MSNAPRPGTTRGITPGLPTNAGSFKATERAETGLTLSEPVENSIEETSWTEESHYATWQPADVDSELARLYGERSVLAGRRDSAYDHLQHEIARSVFGRGWRGNAKASEVGDHLVAVREIPEAERTYDQRSYLQQWDRIVDMDERIAAKDAEMDPLNAEFERRGGWTRAFLVTNQGGHVHASMRCHTCRPTTQYHWVTELSDHDEAEIVEKAGARACTSCYPSAPVEVLNRPTQIFSPEEREKQAAAAERDAAKVKRAADKIAKGLTPDGSEFRIDWIESDSPGHDRDPVSGQSVWSRKPRPKHEYFKTETAAVQWLVRDLVWNKDRPQELADKQQAYEAIITAIAAKHDRTVEDVRAEIDSKVAAKRKRDGFTD